MPNYPFMQKLSTPNYIKAPWLTLSYIKRNAFYPVIDEWLDNVPREKQYVETEFGAIPLGE